MNEDARALHQQAQERVQLIESEVHHRVVTGLERAQERIFETIRQEMDAIFGELEASLQIVLDDGTLAVHV